MSIGELYFRRSSDASVSLHSFASGCASAVPAIILIGQSLWLRLLLTGACGCALAAALLLLLPIKSFPHFGANAKRGLLLGCVFAFGVVLVSGSANNWQFGVYACFLAAFHWSEFYVTAVTNPATLRISSYMLDHSPEYHIAAAVSWAEFWLEAWLLPGVKEWKVLIALGICMCCCGELLRKAAMATAGTNFNHIIEHKKRVDHELVTHGVYKLARHPSYTGWFMWAVGTQVLLCNPISLTGYTIVTWRFFRERIMEEERLLINFFKQSYLEYQRSTWSGIPFVYGYFYTGANRGMGSSRHVRASVP